MNDDLLAHAIVDAGAAPPVPPEQRAARQLSLQLVQRMGERPLLSTWRTRASDGQEHALVVLLAGATEPEREHMARALERLVAAGPLEGVRPILGVTQARDAFLSDLRISGCMSDLPAFGWSVVRRLEFLRDLVRAVGALHAAGIVHGCLCEQNVLLDDAVKPVLAEAGMVSVRLLSARDGYGTSYKSAAAPEVRRGDAPTVRSDLWSVGRLLEQLIAPEEASALAGLRDRCLASLPSERPADAGELAAAIEEAMRTLASEAPAPAGARRPAAPSVAERRTAREESATPAGRLARRRRLRRWAGGVGGVAMVTAMSVAVVFGADSEAERSALSWTVLAGALVLAWALPLPSRLGRAGRAGYVVSAFGLVTVLDPVGFGLRWGMLHRIRGSDESRRAAVAEILELGRDFRGLNLSRLDLSGLDLTGADLRGADLSGADLSRARLWAAEVEGASFKDAQVQGANLEEVSLGVARSFEQAQCDEATRMPPEWCCVDGRPRRR